MEEISPNQNQAQRPQLLTVLAILSFIGSGMSFFSNVLTIFMYNTIVNINVSEISALYPDVFTDNILHDSFAFFSQAGRVYFFFGALASAGSLYGVYLMWNLQKVGLHFYALAQIVILILPLIFVSTQLSVLPGLILTALFVLLYYRSFKMMEHEV